MERFFNEVGGSRQLYNQRKKSQARKSVVVHQLIQEVGIWRIRHPRMGSRVLYHSMIESGFDMPIGITSFEKLLSDHNMTVGTARRSGPYTSDGLGKEEYQNLASGMTLRDINQLVVADMTYFWVNMKWCYLFVLKDVYSQRIVSLIPSVNMQGYNVIENLIELEELRGKGNLKGCIFHTDNGSQYNFKDVKNKLCKMHMKISRSKSCSENGSSEQGHHIIKNMYLKHYGIQTIEELKMACKRVKQLMNEERAVEQLGNMTVQRFEEQITFIPREKRCVKTLYDFSEI